MDQIYERCCGLDVHKKSITACAITPEGKEIKAFDTMTDGILELQRWLRSKQCSHVAMEATGVYWKPIYNLLELDDIKLLVVNAHHIKNVPGRKTDTLDAEWIANLLRHGLLNGSFIPEREQRELRELVRYRRSLIQERAREVSRLQKVLEGANIKLASVASNILGVSGRAMIEALIHGNGDPELVADLAKGKLKGKREQLTKALKGLVGSHQKLVLETQLKHIDFLDERIEDLDQEVATRLSPFQATLDYLDVIPGVGRKTIEDVLAEIGVDMSRFPTSAHLASWAGICPGNNESAGKRKSGRTRKGSKTLRAALVEAARSIGRTKGNYLSDKYHRLSARRGSKRAAIAIAHKLLIIFYHMLKTGTQYRDLGPDFLLKYNREAHRRGAVKRLEALGYKVELVEQSAN